MKRVRVFFVLTAVFLLTAGVRPGGLFAQTPQPLQFGSYASGALGPGQEIWYSLRSAANGFAVFEIISGFDSYLEIYDAARTNQLAFDDDSGDGGNARIEFFVSAGTTYLVKVRGFSSDHSGDFRLYASLNPAPVPIPLNFGAIRSANLSDDSADWYSVRAAQIGFLTIEALGGTVSYIDVYDNNFTFQSSAYYNEDLGSARMEFLTEANKTYNIRIRGNPRGAYRILASFNVPRPIELGFGSQRSGNIIAGEAVWYSIRPTQAVPVVVETFSSIDTYLEIYNTDYELLHSDDDSGGDLQAKITFITEANKTYLIKARGLNASVSGPFQIRAVMEPVAVLPRGGTAAVNFTLPNESKWFRYVISSSNSFIELHTRGTIDTTLTLYDSQGKQIAYDDDSGENLNARIVERLSAGTYLIQVRRFSEGVESCTLHAAE